MTAAELIDKARFLLAAGNPDSPWYQMEIEANLVMPQAMHILGMAVANDPRRFGILQQQYSVSLNFLGLGNLATTSGALTARADIIWETVGRGHVRDANNEKLIYVPEFAQFVGYLLPGYQYYTLSQQQIFTRIVSAGYYNGDSTGVTGPLTVTASYFPYVGTVTDANTLPTELQDDAVEHLARILQIKYEPEKKAA